MATPKKKAIAKAERVVAKGYGILAIILSIPAALLVSVLFSITGEVTCTRNPETKKRVCEEHFVLKGWDGIPLEAIAASAATGFSIYFSRRKWAEKVGSVVTGEKIEESEEEQQP